MLEASEKDIQWLLFDSGVSFYRIGKDTGLSESNIYRLQQGQSQIENLRFTTACILTEYARKVKQEEKRSIHMIK